MPVAAFGVISAPGELAATIIRCNGRAVVWILPDGRGSARYVHGQHEDCAAVKVYIEGPCGRVFESHVAVALDLMTGSRLECPCAFT